MITKIVNNKLLFHDLIPSTSLVGLCRSNILVEKSNLGYIFIVNSKIGFSLIRCREFIDNLKVWYLSMSSKSDNLRKMKISQLVKESGFSKSTIRHYLLLGLLHQPLKTGKTAAIYDVNHLEKLKDIRQLKEDKGLSLSEIKEILQKSYPTTDTETLDYNKRDQIIEKAISNFSKNGFMGTTINDITKAVGLKKSTFYSYFKSKREFFIICADYITRLHLKKFSLEDINTSEDFEKRQRLRTSKYLSTQNKYSSIINYLKVFLASTDTKQSQLARETLRAFIDPIIMDTRLAISKGMIGKVDPVLLAYAIFGLIDGISHAIELNPRYTIQDGVNFIIDLISSYTNPK